MSAHTSARSPVGQPRRLYCWAAALSCSDKTAGTGQSVIALTVVSPETVRNHQKRLLFCSWSDVICTNRSWEWEHLPDNKTGTNTSRAKAKIWTQPRDVLVFARDVAVATVVASSLHRYLLPYFCLLMTMIQVQNDNKRHQCLSQGAGRSQQK